MTFTQTIGFHVHDQQQKEIAKQKMSPIVQCPETKYADEMVRTGFLFSHFRTKYWIRTTLETARWKRRRATKPLTTRCAFLTACTALVKARLIGLALTCF